MSGFLLSNRATRALARLLRGKMGDSSTANAVPSPISRNRTAEPFALKYAASANSAAGAWIIWLSANSLIYAGTAIDLTAGLVAAGTPYPAGWYQVGVLTASGGSLYLIIDASGSTPTASFAASASSQAGRTSILIATATRDTTTGAVSVRQNIVGALAYGGGGGSVTPDDVSVDLRDSGDAHNDGKLQIKDWDHSSPPASNTSIANDLLNGTGKDLIVCRDANKQLVYKEIGDLTNTGGLESAIDATVVCYTDPVYSTTTHKYTAKKVTMTFVKGLLVNHVVSQPTTVFTATPHSAEHS